MAITARRTGDVVGMVTLHGISLEHRRAAVGYWILPRQRGHGYAKAAVSLLPGLARDLGLARIEALIEPSNLASQAVCRDLGFAEEGLLRSYYRIGDANRDMIMFARLIMPAAG